MGGSKKASRVSSQPPTTHSSSTDDSLILMASFTDPATGNQFDCSNPDHKGWLTKQVFAKFSLDKCLPD